MARSFVTHHMPFISLTLGPQPMIHFLSVLSTSLTAPYHYAPQGAPTRSGGGMSVARTDGEKWRRARRDERDEDRAVVRPKAKRVGAARDTSEEETGGNRG